MNYNVLHQDEVNDNFRDFCQRRDIQIVAYQPVKRRAVLEDELVLRVADAHGATAAQVALAWLIQMGSLPIPKATNRTHIDENLGALGLTLTEDEMARLAAHAKSIDYT